MWHVSGGGAELQIYQVSRESRPADLTWAIFVIFLMRNFSQIKIVI